MTKSKVVPPQKKHRVMFTNPKNDASQCKALRHIVNRPLALNLTEGRMTGMPSLKNQEWGLKYLCGVNSHHSFQSSLPMELYSTTSTCIQTSQKVKGNSQHCNTNSPGPNCSTHTQLTSHNKYYRSQSTIHGECSIYITNQSQQVLLIPVNQTR